MENDLSALPSSSSSTSALLRSFLTKQEELENVVDTLKYLKQAPSPPSTMIPLGPKAFISGTLLPTKTVLCPNVPLSSSLSSSVSSRWLPYATVIDRVQTDLVELKNTLQYIVTIETDAKTIVDETTVQQRLQSYEVQKLKELLQQIERTTGSTSLSLASTTSNGGGGSALQHSTNTNTATEVEVDGEKFTYISEFEPDTTTDTTPSTISSSTLPLSTFTPSTATTQVLNDDDWKSILSRFQELESLEKTTSSTDPSATNTSSIPIPTLPPQNEIITGAPSPKVASSTSNVSNIGATYASSSSSSSSPLSTEKKKVSFVNPSESLPVAPPSLPSPNVRTTSSSTLSESTVVSSTSATLSASTLPSAIPAFSGIIRERPVSAIPSVLPSSSFITPTNESTNVAPVRVSKFKQQQQQNKTI